MANERNERKKRSRVRAGGVAGLCVTGKQKYPTIDTARQGAYLFNWKTENTCMPYQCRTCGAFHIGHKA